MKTERWMKHPVVGVKPHDSIAHAREVMEKHRFNQLPVVVDGRLVGIVTDRDLRDAYPSVFETAADDPRHAPAVNPKTIKVEDVMTANLVTLGPAASVEEAARLMRRERIGAIPVVDGHRLVGMLTRSDVLDAFLTISDPRTP